MHSGETELDMVLRHVCRGEQIVARQRQLIANLKLYNLPIDLAKLVLVNFDISLRAHRDHLQRLLSH